MSTVAKTTIASLSKQIVTEADAYRHLEGLRWGDTPGVRTVPVLTST